MDERDKAVDHLAEQLYLKTWDNHRLSVGFQHWTDLPPERADHYRNVINHLLTFTDDIRAAS